MSELTTGGINFGYESPISQIYKDVEYKFKEDMENKTMEAIHHFGISVDKEELIKALQYDRNQYDKGYSDGRASIVEELENQKTGHWILTDVEGNRVWNCNCSECGKDPQDYIGGSENWWLIKNKLPKYCPNCGAKMEGENNE